MGNIADTIKLQRISDHDIGPVHITQTSALPECNYWQGPH